MTQSSIVAPSSHKSRWGYHVCDWKTYRKMKRLNHLIERTKHLAAAQVRWDRKTVNQGAQFVKVVNKVDGKRAEVAWIKVPNRIPRPECPMEYSFHQEYIRLTDASRYQSMYRLARIPQGRYCDLIMYMGSITHFNDHLEESLRLLDKLEEFYFKEDMIALMRRGLHAGIAKDELLAALRKAYGIIPCRRCDGTGNQLYSMYQECQACHGDGESKGNEDQFED